MSNKLKVSSLAYTSIGACCVTIGVLFFQNSIVKYILLGLGILFCFMAVIIAAKNKK